MLSLVILGLLCPTFTTRTLLHSGPIGIAMCKLICKTTFGCKSYTFRRDSNDCYHGKIKFPPGDQAVTGEVKHTWIKDGISKTTCRSLSRIIYSRSRKPVCVKLRNMEAGPKEDESKLIQLKYHIKDLSFDNAKLKCKEEGGSLAQFQMGFDEDTLKQIFLGNKYDCAWIDLTYHKELKQFNWGDGTPFLEEDRWSKYEPSHQIFGFGDENCVCLKNTLLLVDYACIKRSDFICQI